MASTSVSTILNYAVSSLFALEQAFPAAGLGATKKQMVLSSVQTLLGATAIETSAAAVSGSNVGTNTEISQISTLVSEFMDSTIAVINKHVPQTFKT